MSLETTVPILRKLERELHQPKSRQDRQRLIALLHPDFREFGRSGAVYRREDILELLSAEVEAVHIHSQNFEASELAVGVVLLTYRSAHVTQNGKLERHTNRSSIWKLEHSQWRMLFHQGTPTEPFEQNNENP